MKKYTAFIELSEDDYHKIEISVEGNTAYWTIKPENKKMVTQAGEFPKILEPFKNKIKGQTGYGLEWHEFKERGCGVTAMWVSLLIVSLLFLWFVYFAMF
jgi:hypothetical protein